MTAESKYLYGPVPSRRLGRSLGVDIIPFKVCTLDCVYCQLGRTTDETLERKPYVPVQDILAEVRQRVDAGLDADYVTIGGSGEPTLHSELGVLIDGIKQITDIPVTVLTNGTLLYRADVRADCCRGDVVLPSLDAGDQETFERINRPHPQLSFAKLVDGLASFRDEYSGAIWLEVFITEGFNTGNEQIARIAEAVKRIRPDKVHLNTAVRPTAEQGISKVSSEKLQEIAAHLGPRCEVIADFAATRRVTVTGDHAEAVLSMLKRRPCSLDDISSGLGLVRNEVIKYLTDFERRGIVGSERRAGVTFFKVL